MAKPTFTFCVLFVVRIDTLCVCVRDRVAVGCVVDVTVATMSQVGVRIFSFFTNHYHIVPGWTCNII